MLQNCVIV